MDIQQKETVIEDPTTGSTQVSTSSRQVANQAEVQDAVADKKNQVVWYIVGIINALLLLRIAFLLFGAKSVGFASLLYAITDPFVALFKGVFPAPSVESAYFDTAALLAIVIVSLVGWGISALIDLMGRPAVVKG